MMDFCQNLNKTYISIAIIVFAIIALVFINNYDFKTKQQVAEKFADSNSTNNKKHKITLYYTSWCGYSKQLLPEWYKFKDHVTNNMSDIEVIDIECEQNKDDMMCKSVPGYPTVIMTLANGKQVNFDGKYERTFDGLMKFAAQAKN
jgi:thiol-disulfide isomerase/thioredoxin